MHDRRHVMCNICNVMGHNIVSLLIDIAYSWNENYPSGELVRFPRVCAKNH